MGRSSKAKPVRIEGLELYRSRPISRQAAERFPHVMYYAVHFDEEAHKFAFLFLGPDASRDEPDVLHGLEALAQWNRFVDVMTRDPVVSGLRVERIGSHCGIQDCLDAARADAAGFRSSGPVAARPVPAPRRTARREDPARTSPEAPFRQRPEPCLRLEPTDRLQLPDPSARDLPYAARSRSNRSAVRGAAASSSCLKKT